MHFRLRYSGTLDTRNEDRVGLKHRLRKYFQPQMRYLCKKLVEAQNLDSHTGPSCWNPFKDPVREGDVSVLKRCGNFQFAPLVSQVIGWHAVARLDILFLRPEPPGQLIKKSGDLDNRVKLLIDGLRMPRNKDELPRDVTPDINEDPFFCLLQDDALVTSLQVESDMLLNPSSEYEVEIVVGVEVRCTRHTMFNSPIW